MPVRRPRCAILSNVPPQVCSTSSRWAAIARTSSGAVRVERADMSVEAPLFQNHILANDQAMSSHLPQGVEYAVHMFIGIHKADDYGKLSSSVYKVTGLNLVSPKKPSHGMDCGRGVNVFPPQVIKDFQMQSPVMPLVGFVEIDGN